MKKLKAYLTVEASLLMPIIMTVTFLMVYMVLYIYNKAILYQDVNTLCAVGIANTRRASTDLTEIIEEEFAVIAKEHPYISVKDMNLTVKRDGPRLSIGMDYEYMVPVCSFFNKKVSYEKTISTVTPVYVLTVVNDLEGDISK